MLGDDPEQKSSALLTWGFRVCIKSLFREGEGHDSVFSVMDTLGAHVRNVVTGNVIGFAAVPI